MRKQIIYAPRLKGDLDLGREPTRVINGQKRYAQVLTDGGLVPGGVVQDTLTETIARNYRVGTKLREDGCTYHYSLSGAVALDLAQIMQSEVPEATHENMLPVGVYAPAASVITVTLAAVGVALNEYRDGWLYINAGLGMGQKLKIMSHPLVAGVNPCAFTCWEALTAATDGTSRFSLIKNPYQDLIVKPASPPTALVVGVPQFTVTAARYFWLLTKGPTPLLTQGAIIIHRQVTPDEAVAGAVKLAIQEITVGAEVGIGLKMAHVEDSAAAPSLAAITGADGTYLNATIDIGNLQNIIGTVMRMRATTEYSMIMLDLGN